MIFINSDLVAQVSTDMYNKGIKAFNKGNYNKAVQFFKRSATEEEKSPEIMYNIALCFLNSSDKPDSAAIYLEESLALAQTDEVSEQMLYDIQLTLAKSYQILLKPTDALNLYKEIIYLHEEKMSELQKAEVNKEIAACENAHIYIYNPVEIKITNMGPDFNSEFEDHSPLLSLGEDKVYFTSRRNYLSNKGEQADGQYYEKIFVSKYSKNGWEEPKMVKRFFRKNEHESATSLSADGKELFLYRNDVEGPNLYVSHFKGGNWAKPIKLPEPINTNFKETHASISPDKSTLFFTSDRPGGFGGMDIYLCRKNSKGIWGEAINMGSTINTALDEESPMIHYDGKTLYFSSEGHQSMGRLDVFYTQMKLDSTWAPPVNLGYPINTADDDFFFVPGIEKKHAFYASSRFEHNYGGSDVYKVEFDMFTPENLAVIEGCVREACESPLRIMATRKSDGAVVSNLFLSPGETQYKLFLEAGDAYSVTQMDSDGEELQKDTLYVMPEMAYDSDSPKMMSFEELKIEPPLFVSMMAQKVKNQKIDGTYAIQILALKKYPSANKNVFKGLNKDQLNRVKCKDGYTRYIYGKALTLEESQLLKEEIRTKSIFKDAFIRKEKSIVLLEE